jgi:large subunit ribosomal protein L6
MSRIGQQPVTIPEQVKVISKGSKVVVKGPKGELEQKISKGIEVKIAGNQIKVERTKETKKVKSLHGLFRTLIFNMIKGVSQGFSKNLELHGTGYRASLEGGKLKILVGFSHPVFVEPPENIEFKVENNTLITVSGIDKQLVGQVAASIREIRKPEPYKGKGISYQGEKIKRKPGKAAKAGEGAVEGA